MAETVAANQLINAALIDVFRKVHGAKYGYEKAIYKGAHKPIIITCTEHGDFNQSPNAHRHGQGCPSCAKKNKRTLSTEDVIKAFRTRHGDKYDYSKVEYKNGRDRITIICPIHQEFLQTANAHKNGQGCPKCSGKQKTQEELITEFKSLFGERFDYSKVSYVNSSTKITIMCKEHGEFEQTPNSHLQGKGCKFCKD